MKTKGIFDLHQEPCHTPFGIQVGQEFEDPALADGRFTAVSLFQDNEGGTALLPRTVCKSDPVQQGQGNRGLDPDPVRGHQGGNGSLPGDELPLFHELFQNQTGEWGTDGSPLLGKFGSGQTAGRRLEMGSGIFQMGLPQGQILLA